MMSYLADKLEDTRVYWALGLGLIGAIIATVIINNSDRLMGFMPIAATVLSWWIYIGVGLYILLSIPVIFEWVRDTKPLRVIFAALFIPISLYVSWIVASRIAYPAFYWLFYEAISEIGTWEIETYRRNSLISGQIAGLIVTISFGRRAASLAQWPIALIYNVLFTIPSCFLPKLVSTLILACVVIPILVKFFKFIEPEAELYETISWAHYTAKGDYEAAERFTKSLRDDHPLFWSEMIMKIKEKKDKE